jgi:prevent-host-death family protein
MVKIVGLKELRENMDEYVRDVGRGTEYVVVRRSKPLFRMVAPQENEEWETVVDFTKIKKGGVGIKEILSRL